MTTYTLRKQISQKKIRERNREWLIAYLLSHPCVDCGETNPIYLEADHRENKKFDVGKMVSSHHFSIKRLEEEMSKCDIRCCKCHRRKSLIERDVEWVKRFL